MAKKKNKNDKPQVINNIQEVKIEIDYEKLGETIKKSISNDQEEKVDTSELQKATLKDWFTVIRLIITNKADTKGKMTPVLLSMIVGVFFNVLSILFALVGVLSLVLGFAGIIDLIIVPQLISEYILYIVVAFPTSLLFLTFALLLRASANEFDKEKDRNYIVSVFSGIVSFVALIVALVALFKGVG